MARENQGLQIALIAFVLLTVLFSATTFFYFRKYDESSRQAETSEKKAAEQQRLTSESQNKFKELKRIAGFAEGDDLDTILKEHAKDMQAYASTFEPENQQYRKVIQYLADTLQKKNADLAKSQEQVMRLEGALAVFEDSKQSQIAKFEERATEAGNDLTSEVGKHKTILTEINAENEKLLTGLQKSRTEAIATVEQAQGKEKEYEKLIAQLTTAGRVTRDRLEKMIAPTFEVALGKIRWADQRSGTVWIDLGRADNLKRQITFSVYSSDINDVTKAGRKGTIEVTEILGEHVAEARIVDDKTSDPITPGDVIHTPVWAPGQRQHFALAGLIDVDGDGYSDRELVKNLLAANGAVVDAEVDDEGNRTGEVTTQTNYLVEGDPPAPSVDARVMNNFSNLTKEAERLNIHTIKVSELLERMGYKDEARVAHFGKHINPKEFPARMPEGQVERFSPGTVSPLYTDKQPPKTTRGSAY